jgi:hypothetical protein
MTLSLLISLATIFFDIVLKGTMNTLFVRVALGTCLLMFVAVYVYWRIFVTRMAA